MSATAVAPLPRISIQAFCVTPDLAAAVQGAAADRRAEKAHLKVQTGGIEAALQAYRDASAPNVIFLEMKEDRTLFLAALEELAQFCEAGTKVVVVGHHNDVILYRELMRRGVSDYLIAPVETIDVLRSISEIFSAPEAAAIGRTVAVLGSKGGVGSSTIAHNLAWSVSSDLGVQTVLADFDLPFGTAGLDFNQDPGQGVADAVYAQDRLDSNLVDRLMTRCSDHLSLLAAPSTLERAYDFEEGGFDGLIDVLRAAAPSIILDLPHVWTNWSRRLTLGADEIVLVVTPDLANLRNAKNIVDETRRARANDSKPFLVFNGVGMAKRPEISVADFAKAIELEPSAVISFDANLFGTAANNGQMIGEVQAKGKAAETIAELARTVTGRTETKAQKRSVLQPLFARLGRKKG